MADSADPVMLPPASVDFNSLNDALHAGEDPATAVENAIFAETLAMSADEARAAVAESAAERPTLSGLTKAKLLEIAGDEGVTLALRDDEEIPVADATNAQIIAAIETRRASLLAPAGEPA